MPHLRTARPHIVFTSIAVTVRGVLIAATVAAALVVSGARAQDATYSSGQNVVPVYEGWEENADGTFNLVFGYYNRNYDEEIDVPVGPNNHVEPGGPDQAQPTRFQPRRNLFVFRVKVPKDFGTKEVVWTLTSRGKTERAYGTLKPIYFINEDIISANNGAAGGRGGTLELSNLNKPPRLTLEDPSMRTIRRGEAVTLSAHVKDDGIPERRALPINRSSTGGTPAVSSATGLRVAWFVYRGAGEVTFDPPQFKVYMDLRSESPWTPGWLPPALPPDGRWQVTATFADAGTYVLRCLAHDGALMTWQDVTVVVQ